MAQTKFRVRFLVLILFCAQAGLGIPNYERVTLPLPTTIAQEDGPLISEALKLEVYEDSENSNHYYFVPPFHVRQYDTGAAGMMLHTHNVKNYAAAVHELDARTAYADSYSHNLLDQLQAQKIHDEEMVEDAREKLALAIEQGNASLIALRKDILDRKTASLAITTEKIIHAEDIIRAGGTLLPRGLGRAYFERALLHIAQIGINLPYSGNEEPETLSVALRNALDEIASSYGGFISINAYGGFTKAQLDALRMYRSKYMPHITVSLMPVDKITFFSLTEWQKARTTASTTKMFADVNGSGDYLGAAIVLDTTIAGSFGLAEHLAPFVLPIGIRAMLKQKLAPTEAKLTCDFANGFRVRGRADIKDGLIIFDNDITNTLKAEDSNDGACSLSVMSGDPKSAQIAALLDVEAKFEALRLNRIALSRSEKSTYLKGVLDDIAQNRRKDERRFSTSIQKLNAQGWESLVLEGLASATDFFWHTNVQDVADLSSIRFTKYISIKGHENIQRDLPTNLCLVYNNKTQAYDRCTNREEALASTANTSVAVTTASSECHNLNDPFLCGRLRESAGLPARAGLSTNLNDNAITNNL